MWGAKTNSVKIFKFDLFTDYFQFYIRDEKSEGITGDAWSKEALVRRLAVEHGAVGISTVRNMDTTVTLEAHTNEPKNDFPNWDHICECGINMKSKRLIVAGCTDYVPDATRIKLAKGQHRVRVSYGNLNDISEDGLEGIDTYRIQIWPSEETSIIVLKEWGK